MDAFDYVVVGGGSSGCALAARLSEDPSITVCLLEAADNLRQARLEVAARFVLTQADSHDSSLRRRLCVARGRGGPRRQVCPQQPIQLADELLQAFVG